MSTSIPIIIDSSGPSPTPPATLRSTLVDNVAATNPDYTANLPGSLIEDIASTDVGALTMIDQARVDAINSVTPLGANAALLAQQGQMFGIPQGTENNASVYVVFSGPAGFVINPGYVVSDGSHQYTVIYGGVIGTSGDSPPLYAVATTYGIWSIAAGSVTTIETSIPTGYTVTVTNPNAGTEATTAETVFEYRARILQAQQVTVQGVGTFLRSNLNAINGVFSRLVSVRTVTGGWEVICGGGDSYEVAWAIYRSVLDLSTIIGSTTTANNLSATLIDGPDSYTVTYVNPPQQTASVAITWNTTLTNFTKSAQVNSLGVVAVQNYINSIQVGQPINLNSMIEAFNAGVSSAIAVNDITTLSFVVKINGTTASPTAGTNIIPSDPESYFYASATDVTSTQG